VRPNQWRIIATGERYTEHDEKRAVYLFREKVRNQQATVAIPLATINPDAMPLPPVIPYTPTQWDSQHSESVKKAGEEFDRMQKIPGLEARAQAFMDHVNSFRVTTGPNNETTYVLNISEAQFFAIGRDHLINKLAYTAKMTGVPELAGLRYLSLPKTPLTLAELFTAYEQRNGSKRATKEYTRHVWERFIKFTEANTIDDLTTEKLQVFTNHIEATIAAPATRKLYYSKIKTIIAFGLKCGLDAEQIRAALDRAKVLWTAARIPAPKPTPISKKDFHTLLKSDTPAVGMRSWLLVGLNLCLHIGEVRDLKWEEFDLDGGTYVSIRGKTEEHRIPRAATLWPETIKALRELKAHAKQSPYVFVSRYGTRFGRTACMDRFQKFRDDAELPHITFDSIRDGAYTAACQLCPDERWARLLAGHRSPGLQDSYVLRNPKIVAPACDAVYKAFGPFPAPATK